MAWTIVNPSQKNDNRQQTLVYKSLFTGTEQTETTRNQAVNGAVTPVRFKQGPPAGQIWQFTRFIFAIRDGGSMDSGGWGNRTAPLINGMTVGLVMDGVDIVLTPIPWKSHFDLGAVAYDLTHHEFGSGDEFLVMRLTFSKAGQNIRLDGDRGDYFWFDVNDDLTYLVEQRAMFQGFIEGVYL